MAGATKTLSESNQGPINVKDSVQVHQKRTAIQNSNSNTLPESIQSPSRNPSSEQSNGGGSKLIQEECKNASSDGV